MACASASATGRNALELPTSHFLLKSDAEPERVLNLAIDAERAWFAFYDALGPALGLYVFDETPEIHVFADAKDYPAPPTPDDRPGTATSRTRST
jgi:hypothetical protein